MKDSKRHGHGELTQIMDIFGQRKKVIIRGKWKEGFLHGDAHIQIVHSKKRDLNEGEQ